MMKNINKWRFKDLIPPEKAELKAAGRENCQYYNSVTEKWRQCGKGEKFNSTAIYRYLGTSETPKPQPPKPQPVSRYPQVIFSGPATVVLWYEGMRTFVKCTDDDYKAGKQDRKLGYLMCHYMHKRKATKTQMHKHLSWIKPERVFEYLFRDYRKFYPELTEKQAKRQLTDITKDPKPSKAAAMKRELRRIRRGKEASR